jgi:HlyD family secretion protein
VELGDISVTISATGNPNAVVTVQVGSQVSGIILALFADFNTKVTKGELIARIDPAPFQAKVDQAQANVDAAQATAANSQAGIRQAAASIQAATSNLAAGQANVVKAKAMTEDAAAKVNRRAIMVKQGATALEDLETAQTTQEAAVAEQGASVAQALALADAVMVTKEQLKAANSQLATSQAQVRQFAAALESARLDLAHTEIKAPVDGVVVSRNVDVGQTVAASLAAPTLFLIAQDLTKMQVDTNVSEADVGRVRVDQPATFTVDAYPRQVFSGSVTSIRKAPINVQNVITYDAVIGVSNPDLKLFPGMTANVKILVNQRPNVLKVPNAALRYRPPSASPPSGGAPTGGGRGRRQAPEQAVWILDAKGIATRVAVTTGESDGTNTEITRGMVKLGDAVIIAGVAPAAASQAAGKTGRGPGF